jgi:hypothetical protein
MFFCGSVVEKGAGEEKASMLNSRRKRASFGSVCILWFVPGGSFILQLMGGFVG